MTQLVFGDDHAIDIDEGGEDYLKVWNGTCFNLLTNKYYILR